jgi:hypothetical protein
MLDGGLLFGALRDGVFFGSTVPDVGGDEEMPKYSGRSPPFLFRRFDDEDLPLDPFECFDVSVGGSGAVGGSSEPVSGAALGAGPGPWPCGYGDGCEW